MFNYSILLAFISLFVLGSVDNLKGPIYPEVLDTLGIRPSVGSWIFTTTSLVSLLTSLLSIYWLKFVSTINSLKVALYFHAVTLLLMGLGLDFKSFWYFLLSSIILGFALGIQGICVNTVVAQFSTTNNSKRLFSGLHSMYGLASLSVPLIVSIFLKKDIALKDMLYLLGFITFLLALVLNIRVKGETNFDDIKTKNELNKKTLIVLSITACFYVSTEILLSSRLVYFLKSYHSFDIELSSLYLSLFFLCLLIGRLFFSFFQLNISVINLLKISVISSFLLFIIGMYIFPLALVLIGLSSSFFFPYLMDYIKNNFKDSNLLIARIMIYVSLSLALMHFLFGLIADQFGTYVAMHINFVLYPVILYFLHFKVDSLARIS
jgi:FHS family glucose/mannose:H+ symporter-like MFS transporter